MKATLIKPKTNKSW